MDRLVYLLFGAVGCVVGMAAWMAVMAVRRRRPVSGRPAPVDAATAPRAEAAPPRAEAHDG